MANHSEPDFLTVEDVLGLHTDQLEAFGGDSGLRDPGLLESAVAQPSATFDGEFLHPDLFTMAAAYLFHLVQNHPFVDGNKRAGLHAALVFLRINGIALPFNLSPLYDLTLGVATGTHAKSAIAIELRGFAEDGDAQVTQVTGS